MEHIAAWLDEAGVRPMLVSLLPYHAYGNHKYARLGLEPPSFHPPTQAHLQEIKAFWAGRGHRAAIGGAMDLGEENCHD